MRWGARRKEEGGVKGGKGREEEVKEDGRRQKGREEEGSKEGVGGEGNSDCWYQCVY